MNANEKTRVVAIVTYSILAMMFILLTAVIVKMFVSPQSADQNLLIMVVQSILGLAAAMVGYYYGSSEGSRKKDELLSAKEKEESK